MTVKEWLEANKPKYYPDRRREWYHDCAKETGCSLNTVKKYAPRIWPVESGVSARKIKGSEDKDIIAPEAFLSGIDVVQKVIGILDNVVKDAYIEDDKLRKRAGISRPKWKEVSGLSRFDGRRFTYPTDTGQKITVWSSINGVRKAQETISMSRYE